MEVKSRSQKRVEPYPDPPAVPEKLVMETHEYHMPFRVTRGEADAGQ